MNYKAELLLSWHSDAEYEETVALHYEKMHSELSRYIGLKFNFLVQEAEDAVSETFVRLLERKVVLQSPEHLFQLLYKASNHRAIDRSRGIKKDRACMETVDAISEIHTNPFETIDDDNPVTLQILDAIMQLPERRGTTMFLHYFKEKSTKEIAEILGINSQTVLNHCTHGLNVIRESIGYLDFYDRKFKKRLKQDGNIMKWKRTAFVKAMMTGKRKKYRFVYLHFISNSCGVDNVLMLSHHSQLGGSLPGSYPF